MSQPRRVTRSTSAAGSLDSAGQSIADVAYTPSENNSTMTPLPSSRRQSSPNFFDARNHTVEDPTPTVPVQGGTNEPSGIPGPNLARASSEPLPTTDQDLKAMLAALVQSTSTLQQFMMAQRSTETRPKIESPRVKEPDVFKGRRSEVNAFITQCLLIFSLQPNRFPDDDTKIRYELSLFREAPLAAVQPHLLKPSNEWPDWLRSLTRLHAYIRANYGDPDERGTAERKLQTLHQTGSATAYFAEFQQYSAVLGWPDEPLVALATRGLSEYIKDLLSQRGSRITTMPELIEVVVNLDNRREERQREKKFQNAVHQPTTDNRPTHRNEQRRDVRHDNRDNRNRVSSEARPRFEPQSQERQPVVNQTQREVPTFFRKLSEEEKARRKSRGECLRCGKTGHIAMDCPTRNAQGYAPGLQNKQDQSRQSYADQSKVSAPSK